MKLLSITTSLACLLVGLSAAAAVPQEPSADLEDREAATAVVSQSIELQIVETLRAAGKLPNRACSSMYCTLGYTGCGNGCSCFHLGNSWLCI